MLTIAYITNRIECNFHWFAHSLGNEVLLGGKWKDIKVVVVDFHANIPGRKEQFQEAMPVEITHVTPKPTVWQGEHRLTNQDYFAASNARNTALCLAPNGHICYVDDISVLSPGWLSQVHICMQSNWIGCGSYMKVRNLKVQDGIIMSFDGLEKNYLLSPQQLIEAGERGFKEGVDSRISKAEGWDPHPAGGS